MPSAPPTPARRAQAGGPLSPRSALFPAEPPAAPARAGSNRRPRRQRRALPAPSHRPFPGAGAAEAARTRRRGLAGKPAAGVTQGWRAPAGRGGLQDIDPEKEAGKRNSDG